MASLTAGVAAGLAALVLCGVAAAQEAEGPRPFPDFTFRRIGVPPPGHTGPRITIQIEPQPVPAAAPAPPDPEPPAPHTSTGAGDWFWSRIPAGQGEGAGRFEAALRHLSTAPEAASLPVLRADGLMRLAEAHGPRLLQATVGTRVSPAFALAVLAVESRGETGAQSGAGAQGLMQLIPATAARFGVEDPFDAGQNIAGGVAYLDWLMEEFGRDPVLVLAGYNAGEGAVRAAGGVPDYRETRDYIPRVLATWAAARLLCITPPELVSDGCVFRSMAGG